MKRMDLFEQPDIGDQSQYVVRQRVDGTTQWPGRHGHPYSVEITGYLDSELPVFKKDSFRLHLGEGKFFNKGAWAWTTYGNHYAMLKRDCVLTGEGRWTDLCLLRPARETDGKRRPDVHMLGVGSDYKDASNAVVDSLDLSVSENVPKDVLVTSGIRGWGDNIRIRNVRIMGLRGSVEPVGDLRIPYEAFGVSFGGGTGHIVEDCYAEGRSYLSAFSASVVGGKFVDCEAFSEDGYAAFTVYENTKVIDCKAWGFAYGVYNDTNEVDNVHVVRSVFDGVGRVAVGLVATDTNYSDKQQIRVRDCEFSADSREPWVGLEMIFKGQGERAKFEDIEFVGCRFSGESPLSIVSTNSKNVHGVRFIDCLFQNDCRLRSNGNEIEIIRPRNLNGSLRTEQIPQAL